MPELITLLEAEALVRKIMKEQEPDTMLDPDNVRFVASMIVELYAMRHFQSNKDRK